MSESSKALEQRAQQAALAAREDAKAQISPGDVVLPLVKLAQASTKAVKRGDLTNGVYYNSLTGDEYGESFELVVVKTYKGRFYSPKGGGTYIAGPEAVVPNNWPDEFSGRAFADLPEAEEQYRAAVNNDEKPWGSGPAIQTTYNLVGFIPSEVAEGNALPVRLSLKASAAKIGKKVFSLVTLSDAPWTNVFEVGRDLATNRDDQDYFQSTVERGRRTTADEAQAAVDLFFVIQEANLVPQGEDGDEATPSREAPESKGGLEVA